ncbi:hypothetical protein ACJIZ3_018218 [Penstemon smallii]|uniref:Uncharacterized protein n=1 Tax=Penstemon smallii TaxID=265156 RepID=A0ABD3SXQ0_9LAMI
MLSFDEGEEVFFDTTDRLLLSEEYDIWLRQPQSVKERRENFLSKMEFVESKRINKSTEAVSSSCESSSESIDDKLLLERRASNSETNCSVDYSDEDWLEYISIESEHESCLEDIPKMDKKQKKATHWWRHFIRTMKKTRGPKLSNEPRTMTRVKIEQNRKKCMEFTGVYTGQEISAHKGLIWTMKFSPDGQYLASGGEDGVVCVWRVTLVDAKNCSFGTGNLEGKSSHPKKKSNQASIIIPEKIFHIEEEPLQKFHGHSSDVLDLAWSTSNHLLSSSKDKTVRLWEVGSEKCLGVLRHSNYVTCVQFNPVDENYFISGSIDGKVRIWGVRNRRVKDWANVSDIVTAVCYQPNGNGFVVGSVSGTCRFYELSGNEFLLNAEINFRGRKKSSGNKITGIQFLKNDSQRVMITSEDSKIRILDGHEVVRKYKGLIKSGSQISSSFTPSGKHIISIGEDSRVYIWNYDGLSIPPSKQTKSTNSCEHFYLKGASVALPWSNSAMEMKNNFAHDSKLPTYDPNEALFSDRFSFANWFSMEGSTKASITWPAEKLPYVPSSATTWGLVFVTANWDGTIRTFHNYGLPIRT